MSSTASALVGSLKFAVSHEWVRVDKNDLVVIGISDRAQKLLGELVFVELPEPNSHIDAGDEVAVVESVKAASDVFSPLSGQIVAVNEALEETPELVNEDALGEGWLYKLRLDDPSELDDLMDQAAYDQTSDKDTA